MAKLFLEANDSRTISEQYSVYGSAGAETLKINGATLATVNGLVDRVEFGGTLASYKFMGQGTEVLVYSGTTLIATIDAQDDANGTVLAFTDGSGSLLQTGLGVFTLAGGAVPTTAGTVTPTSLNPADKSTVISTPPTPTFDLTANSTSINEGGTLAFTVTAASAVASDTTFTYTLTGSGTNPAGADDFITSTNGSVTILAGQTTGTFNVTVKALDSSEFSEGFTATLLQGTTVIDTFAATINDTSTADSTNPVAVALTANYNENVKNIIIPTPIDTVIATVTATDNIAVTNFEIVSGNGSNFFKIDAQGQITLTDAGLKSAANDFETQPNAYTLGVKAIDAAGNKSAAVDVKLEEKDVDDTAPTIKSAVIVGNTVYIDFGGSEVLDITSSPLPADFTVHVAGNGATGVNNVTSVSIEKSRVILTLANPQVAGQTFTFDYVPSGKPLQDSAGNDVVTFAGQTIKTDGTAPVITAGQTASYLEGTNDDVTDIVYTVKATDADSSISSFAITSGDSGYYTIDNSGNIHLTAAGLAGAANDWETTPNSFTLGVKATDIAGNSSTSNVVINVANNSADDPVLPLELYFKTGTDTQEGKSGNDTFTGDSDTIDAGDVIDGNEGTDIARLFLDKTDDAFTSREVEIMEVQGTGTGTLVGNTGAITRTLVATNFTGVTTITNNGSSFQPFVINGIPDTTGSGNGNLKIWDVPNLVTVGFNGGDGTDDYTVNFRSGVTTGELNVTAGGGNIRNLNVGDSTGTQDFSSIKINSTGTISNTITDILDGNANTVNGVINANANANAIGKLTVTGDKLLTITNTLENVSTFDLAQSSGGVSVVVDTTKSITLTGGSGGDKVNVGAAGLTNGDKIDGGTGIDYFIISDGYDAAADQTGMFTSANAINIKSFDILQTANNGSAEIYDVDNIIANNALVGVVVAGIGNTTINNINSVATANINVVSPTSLYGTTNNITFTAKNFIAGGNNDTATINYGSQASTTYAINTSTLNFSNLDKGTITSNQTVSSAVTHNINSLNASDLTSLTITGNAALNVRTVYDTNPTLIDASGLVISTTANGLSWNQSADNAGGGVVIKGTNVSDTLIGNGYGATTGDTFYPGQGSDSMTVDNSDALGGSYAFMKDAFIYTATALNSGDLSAKDVDNISGFSGDNDVTTATAAVLESGDDVIDFTSSVEALLKSEKVVLSDATANVKITGNGGLSSFTNITTAVVNSAGVVTAGGDNLQIQIDLNGDGKYVSGSDFAINLYGQGSSVLYYDALNDMFFIDGVTYTMTPAVTNYNEGTSAVFNIAAPDVANGTVVNYSLSNANDLTGGVTSGSVTVNNGVATITTPVLIADATTEGTETLDVYLYQPGDDHVLAQSSTLINDTSTSVTVLTVTPGATSYTEGSSAIFNVTTSGATDGAVISYRLTGVETTDITDANLDGDNNPLTGTFTVTANAGFFSVALADDQLTETNQTLTATVGGLLASTTVVDIGSTVPRVITPGTTVDVVAVEPDAEIFSFDVAAAKALTANTQLLLTNFSVVHDSLRIDTTTALGTTTLNALNGVDGITVASDPTQGITINFGPDANGDVIIINLFGIADDPTINPALVNITVI